MSEPLLADDGYPSEAELDRIKTWPVEALSDLIDLMAYVRERWSYPDYWTEADIEEYGHPRRSYTLSTGGWSGNESLIGALESHTTFSIVAPWSWRRGGHYEYRIPLEPAAALRSEAGPEGEP